jgi:DMSO/TMAO reductase YedYZ molybdopterin-dependent catalytic subunit
MTRYWPRRAAGLPPGQRLMAEMPRFANSPNQPPPATAGPPSLDITRERQPLAKVSAADLEALRPREQRADFHCVTTWSVTGLTWTGVPLREVLAAAGIAEAPAPYLVASAGDGYSISFLSEDATAPDVLLATHLDGAPLDDRHGAPLRLVTPSQYGYKNVKHLTAIDFRTEPPRLRPREHRRARVAHEERHPTLPSWLVRLPYRLIIPPTAYLAERSLRRHQRSA